MLSRSYWSMSGFQLSCNLKVTTNSILPVQFWFGLNKDFDLQLHSYSRKKERVQCDSWFHFGWDPQLLWVSVSSAKSNISCAFHNCKLVLEFLWKHLTFSSQIPSPCHCGTHGSVWWWGGSTRETSHQKPAISQVCVWHAAGEEGACGQVSQS